MGSIFRVQQFARLLCVGADPPRPDVGSDGHRGDPPPIRQGQGSPDLPPPGLVSTCTHVKVTFRSAGRIGYIHWTGVSILCYFLIHLKALYLKFLYSNMLWCCLLHVTLEECSEKTLKYEGYMICISLVTGDWNRVIILWISYILDKLNQKALFWLLKNIASDKTSMNVEQNWSLYPWYKATFLLHLA